MDPLFFLIRVKQKIKKNKEKKMVINLLEGIFVPESIRNSLPE